ncbi:hypothetical protein BDY17DRAFT_131405 [Neohortaea acidophila]|uniref:Uncharacterized protein n=1 Tax=Neohortaea acidophila TaxID=245834 RepID=A0A6A6PXY4_9PEZI|nr:uncharacterized protein BDY17DRAFT_131405 [Neohortaea acidophila]KAF2484579.1 hypothetical protein BDY17DRAFT_131405 [Neohortaea acidophila]
MADANMAEDTEVFDLTHDEDAAHSSTQLGSANGSTAERKRKAAESTQYGTEDMSGEQVEQEVSEYSNTPAKRARVFDSFEGMDDSAQAGEDGFRARNPFTHFGDDTRDADRFAHPPGSEDNARGASNRFNLPSGSNDTRRDADRFAHPLGSEDDGRRALNPFAHPSAFGDDTRQDADQSAHSSGSDNDPHATFSGFTLPSSSNNTRQDADRFAYPPGSGDKTRGPPNRFTLPSSSEDENRGAPTRFAHLPSSKDDIRGAPNRFAHLSGSKDDNRDAPSRFSNHPSHSGDESPRSKLDYEAFTNMPAASVGRRKAKGDMLPPSQPVAARSKFQLSRGEHIGNRKQYRPLAPYPENTTLLSKDTNRMSKHRDAYLQHRNPHPTTTTHAQQAYDRGYHANTHNQYRPQIPIPTLPASITDRATDWPSLFATLNTIPDLLRTVAAELEQPFLAMDHRCTLLDRRVHEVERENAALGREVEALRRMIGGLESRVGRKIAGLVEFVEGGRGNGLGEGEKEGRGEFVYGGLPGVH